MLRFYTFNYPRKGVVESCSTHVVHGNLLFMESAEKHKDK